MHDRRPVLGWTLIVYGGLVASVGALMLSGLRARRGRGRILALVALLLQLPVTACMCGGIWSLVMLGSGFWVLFVD